MATEGETGEGKTATQKRKRQTGAPRNILHDPDLSFRTAGESSSVVRSHWCVQMRYSGHGTLLHTHAHSEDTRTLTGYSLHPHTLTHSCTHRELTRMHRTQRRLTHTHKHIGHSQDHAPHSQDLPHQSARFQRLAALLTPGSCQCRPQEALVAAQVAGFFPPT